MESSAPKEKQKIQITKNGPYLVSGDIPLYRLIIECDGLTTTPKTWGTAEKLPTKKTYLLCRCGQSNKKPFCDGTHSRINFKGTEQTQEPYEQRAKQIDGPELTLKDAAILCASARFCHRGGDIWDQIPQSNNQTIKDNCIKNAFDCPSGRLVIFDKQTKGVLEPRLEPSIGVIEDPTLGIEGPLWIRGGIPIYSSDDKAYEIRNRVTLCRCGKSTNKPFCDSTHYPEQYQEER
jgi:CDGSH-type Zn-finger protein